MGILMSVTTRICGSFSANIHGLGGVLMRNGTEEDEEARFLSQGFAMLNLVLVLSSLLVRESVPKIGGVARIGLVDVEYGVLREFCSVIISAANG